MEISFSLGIEIALIVLTATAKPILEQLNKRTFQFEVVNRIASNTVAIPLCLAFITISVILYNYWTDPLPEDQFALVWWYPEIEYTEGIPAESKWEKGQSTGIFQPSDIPDNLRANKEKCLLYASTKENPVRISAPFISRQGTMIGEQPFGGTLWCFDWWQEEAYQVEISRGHEVERSYENEEDP